MLSGRPPLSTFAIVVAQWGSHAFGAGSALSDRDGLIRHCSVCSDISCELSRAVFTIHYDVSSNVIFINCNPSPSWTYEAAQCFE